MAFLQDALALAPTGLKIACVRADSVFFENGFLSFLEGKKLPYIVVARMTSSIRARCTGLTEWTVLDENYAVGEIWLKLHGWLVERRFVVLRERVREDKSAVGRRLIDVPGYTFRIFVTNRSESAEIIWRYYNGRACIEQRTEELKNDLAADGFCVREFFGTESAFLGVLFAFNLLSLYQRQVTPEKPLPPTRNPAQPGLRRRCDSRPRRQTNRHQTVTSLGRPLKTQATH